LRALIISVISMLVLVAGWGIFVKYTDEHLHELRNMIDEEILVSVSQEEWETASSSFEDLSEKWHKQKKVYSFFIDTQAINNTDYSIAKAKSYIKAEDYALATGELACIKEQLGFMHLNELITLENIF
jgi:hypothetical protein